MRAGKGPQRLAATELIDGVDGRDVFAHGKAALVEWDWWWRAGAELFLRRGALHRGDGEGGQTDDEESVE
jgi:hypothetical protein